MRSGKHGSTVSVLFALSVFVVYHSVITFVENHTKISSFNSCCN